MGAIFSPIFPSHRRTLWARNFSFEYVKWGYLKFHPLKGFFDTIIRLACRSQSGAHFDSESKWAIFPPIFPSHCHTLWARNLSFESVKWGWFNFHPLKGFVSTSIRSACRSQNVVLFLTRSQKEQFFPLFSPLIAIPYELEIYPLSMLNGAISNFTPWKDFFLRSSVRP